jgi:hypothetical protein
VSCLGVEYCIYLQTLDSILTSVTIIRHLFVCTLVTTIRGQCFEPPTDYSSLQTIPFRLFLLAYMSAPMRREQHGSGGDSQINLFPVSSALHSQTNKMWEIGIGMQLPGHLVPETLCYDMPLSNQTLVTRINGRCE